MDTTDFNNSTNIIGKIDNRDKSLILHSVSDKKSIRDIFLDDEDEIEDAEIFYPSKMNGNSNSEINKEVENKDLVQPFLMASKQDKPITLGVVKDKDNKPFIVANTIDVQLEHLRNDCIIPVFSKDNEKTIAHQEFIDVVYDSVSKMFPYQSIAEPEIRVSHQIKGRIRDVIHKYVKD